MLEGNHLLGANSSSALKPHRVTRQSLSDDLLHWAAEKINCGARSQMCCHDLLERRVTFLRGVFWGKKPFK